MDNIHPRRYYRNFGRSLYDLFWYHLLPDEWSIAHDFNKNKKMGYKLNLKNPQTFNEKIQWIKLHDHNPLYPKLIDKIAVKEVIAKEFGSEYVIPMIVGPYRHFDEIPLSDLPERFVIKCNHDAASTIVCKNKSELDIDVCRKKIDTSLSTNYYNSYGKQWAYKDIKPKVFVEKFMQNKDDEDLKDYKFLFFGKECKAIFVYSDRRAKSGLKMNAYDCEWKKLPFTRHYPNTDCDIPKPKNFDKMLEFANKLAAFVNNAFVRIDLYDINDSIYFGEFTFYPGNGFEDFNPVEWDYTLGSWMCVPFK